jgi:lipoate-protein ligase A
VGAIPNSSFLILHSTFVTLTEMTKKTVEWRLILDGNLPGAVNMARDVAVLEAVSEGESPPALRFYGWNPPCLTLGRHQGVEAANLEFCRTHGIDVVRRPTGGRALLHHHELTYAVIAPLGTGSLPHALQEAYRAICGALVAAVRELGANAELTRGEANLQLPGPRSTAPCFEAPAGGEVVVGGRKLIGSAMRAHAGTILQHGAILIDWDNELQTGAMGLSNDSDLRHQVTTLARELNRQPPRQELEITVVEAFSTELGLTLAKVTLTEGEEARSHELAPSFDVG